jgi:hypothetical protein
VPEGVIVVSDRSIHLETRASGERGVVSLAGPQRRKAPDGMLRRWKGDRRKGSTWYFRPHLRVRVARSARWRQADPEFRRKIGSAE